MPKPNAITICQKYLFTDVAELHSILSEQSIQRLIRIRELYTWFISYPNVSDRDFVARACQSHHISRQQAYSDLAVIKAILPSLHSATREFHRYRANEMLLETYRLAKVRKDTKSMERAASSYAKINRVDLEDEKELPFDLIVVQPFTPTMDPSVLGIRPIPNLDKEIKRLYDKYSKDIRDIEEIDYEEVDLLEDKYFPEPKLNEDGGEESLL